MKLNINKLKKMTVPEKVVDFMTAHGTNHQLLLKAWKKPEHAVFHDELDVLILCLAYEIQKDAPKKAIVNRIRGRIAKVRHQEETFDFEYHLNPTPDFLM
jgi:hypothetical protein